MPRLDRFEVILTTGEQGRDDLPAWKINGFEQPFVEVEGTCASGMTFKGIGQPRSFPHSLVISGPAEGSWDIQHLVITYHNAGAEPYTVEFGAIEVTNDADVNIVAEPPLATYDV